MEEHLIQNEILPLIHKDPQGKLKGESTCSILAQVTLALFRVHKDVDTQGSRREKHCYDIWKRFCLLKCVSVIPALIVLHVQSCYRRSSDSLTL